MAYHAVHIVLNKPEEADLLTGLLSLYDFNGFEEQRQQLIAYIPSSCLPSEATLKSILKGFAYSLHKVPDLNWNSVWESQFEPVVVGNFCGIRADFHPPFKEVQHEIIINPRMSFGTGHHATTKMMISLMQPLELKGKKILDFGTGTGILSILAAKMGAEKIVAIDNDPYAVENASQNIQENITAGIALYCQDHPDTGERNFDLILANINRNTILNKREALLQQLKKGGMLLLSGFLKEDKLQVLHAFKKSNCILKKELNEGNWTAVALSHTE